jgi:hypothetical protein
MKLSASKNLLIITVALLTLSLITTGCSKAKNDTTTTTQDETVTAEVSQPQTTDNTSFPGMKPVDGQFTMGLDMVKLSNILGIEQEKVEAAFSEATKNMFGNNSAPFSGNMSGMRPPDNLNGKISSGDTPGIPPSENFTGGQRPEIPEGGNLRSGAGVPDEVIEAAAEILDITPQELGDAIAKLDS